jgi:thioredoxin reductase (NADPH)
VNKPVLLVADDDPQVLAALRRDLRSRYTQTYAIVRTSSGEEALKTIRELKARGDAVAMIISDQRMPGMHGTELLTQSREIYPIAKRVLLTAYADIAAAVRAINEAQVDHYLSKPWDPPGDKLFPVVDELLDEWRAEYLPETTGLRLIGHQWSPRSHEIKDFLASNLVPYRWMDIERHPDAPGLIAAASVGIHDLPALIFEDGSVLRDPDRRMVAERLGRSTSAAHDLYDLVIVGAGPAGLAASVYGASEGLRTLLLDRHGPGGQAGTSSKIENYLGFPSGVTGSELTRRAVMQAQRLGAEFLVPLEVAGLAIRDGYNHLTLADGRAIVTRTVLAATGMAYREHPASGVSEHAGAGVYYGAATTEGAVCAGRRVAVIGGGNSAGQGAMYLSRFAADVQIVVRRDSLRDTMSRYLIDQIEKTPNIRVRTQADLCRVEGEGRVERVAFTSARDHSLSLEDVDAVFIFIGTKPRSDWLPADVLRDAKGFVLTGRELAAAEAFPRVWKETREPLSLETSAPGIFAAGDIRAGAMNRVASAVGEGSMVVRLVHEYLAVT